MNSQRVFWLSGALTLAVLAILGAAVNSRQVDRTAYPTPAALVQSEQPSYIYRENQEEQEDEHREREHGEHREHSRHSEHE